jgi:hypothetical protein
VKEAIALVQEFQEATKSLEVPKGLDADSVVKWVPPPCGYIKINWDAASNPGMKQTGIRVLIRDDKEELIAAQAKVLPSLLDPSMAEALGAWYAVKLGCDLGFSHVLFQGDCLNVVVALNKDGPCDSIFGHLIEDTQNWFQRLHPFFVHHVRRQANMAAHGLAKLAISLRLDNVWKEDCPSFIHDVNSCLASY